ncbi:MAG TPA: response regulator [Polyangiales bacterium]|nr:response regulator [Polyangiales bacterium]
MTRVLIVDDITDNRCLLRALLEGSGYEVEEAEHGFQALEKARANLPQLIVSDLLMPVMDGYALLREWKKDPQLQLIPFVVYTATYTEPKDQRLGLDLGADAFIVKPAEPSSFMRRLAEVLSCASDGDSSLPHVPVLSDLDLVNRYTSTLIRKLEAKAAQLERANRSLQEDIAQRERAEAEARRLLVELERTHAQLVESEARLSQKTTQLDTALGMARMGVWCWDLRTDEVTTLHGHGPLTRLSSTDYPRTAQAMWALVDADDRPLLNEKVERAKQGADYDAEFRLVLPSSEVRWCAVRGRCVFDSDGDPTFLTGLDQDITERKTLEERLRHSQKIEAIGQLAGGIAHDFNNILAAIIGNAELARIYIESDESPLDCVSEIIRASQRGKELTHRILTFGRPNAFRLKPIHVAPVLDEAERLLRATLPAGVNLSFTSVAAVPPVRADASQIHQVVLNLVTNSWHALGGKSGQVDTRLELAQVDATFALVHPELQPGSYIRLTVSDSGVGMDAATLERMFEPFYTTKAHGAGLGLSVVHGIVRGHGGAIFAESQPGRGTTFSVYLPACPEGTSVIAATDESAPRHVHGHGEHIMYIDDEESLVYLAVRFLEHVGYRVDGYTRVDDALVAFRARPRSYDVVITDYNMPGMSGMDLAQQLMRIRPDAPVALTTGYLRPAEVEQAHALGIREVIPKPYLVEELGPLVQRMLSPLPSV